MDENEIASCILDASFSIHRKLGPGLFESVYEEILCHELDRMDIRFRRQPCMSVTWDDLTLKQGFRADLIVEEKVIVEIKSIDTIAPVHKMQLLTYLKLTNNKLGLLINFNEELLKNGIKRIVNNL